MRGCVFLESLPTADAEANSNNSSSSLPPVCISEDTSRFRYTYRGGLRSAIRVARNRYFSFDMAFGEAGFAISSPLAKVLAKVFDSCVERYPHLYGSDSRVYSCLAELGVGLTREPGFHQVYGKHMHLPDILPVQETFKQWKKCWQGLIILTRVIHSDPCQRPTIFYLDSASSGRDGIRTHYKKWYQNCTNSMGSQRKLEEIRVLSQKLDLNIKQELLPIICLIFSAKLMAPRRHCCDVLPSSARQAMEIAIRECKDDEIIHMHPQA
ncbi:hypothetical protein CUMW_272100 [Citrus unshiu]|uniref:Uncharacterized protein n=1 Tax=Citrus unshiu TaxID=55188 RepID=A0A2H5QXV0_CITUN|nr:hypothetical protein CUMW_272100 [Citrus unshiu]